LLVCCDEQLNDFATKLPNKLAGDISAAINPEDTEISLAAYTARLIYAFTGSL
jgi:hypothetical protein